MSETFDFFYNSHQKVPDGYFVKEPLSFFQKSPPDALVMCLSHLVWLLWGFFQKAPAVWSKCTQWVFFKELTKNSQYGSISPQTLKELTNIHWVHFDHMVGTFWKNPQRTHTKWLRYIMSALWGDFWKKPRGSFTKYPPGTFWCELWKGSRVSLVIRSTFTHWVLDGYFLNVPTSAIGGYLGGYFVKILNMCPVGIWVGEVWAKCKNNQNGPSG